MLGATENLERPFQTQSRELSMNCGEGEGALRTIQLSEPSSKIVRVGYGTFDGSARAGLDYEMSGGVLEFLPGDVARSIELHVFGDTTPEPDQSFFVVLSDPENAVIGNGIGTVTILNDDGPVTGPPRRRPSRH